MMQGFPGYFKLPEDNSILKHIKSLIKYWASRYFAHLPTLDAESGSLTLCAVFFLLLPSDPSVTRNALAIRIIFPLIWVMLISFNQPGLPDTPGKHRVR